MASGYGNPASARETNAQLARLISEERETVTFDKQRYDLRFPKHTKELSSFQLWHIARTRTIAKLCTPACDMRVEGCGESQFF